MVDTTFRHQPEFEELDQLEDWQLEHKSQDIRGRPLVTAAGQKIGIIDDLLVNREDERVAAVSLDDGRMTAVEYLEIENDRVVYRPAGTGVAAGTVAGHHGDARHKEKHIPVVEEEVAIGKRAVEGGSIRVTSRVVKDRVSEDVKLRDETVQVERRSVDQDISAKDAKALLKEGTVEFVEHDEEAVVEKRAKVTGEVVVSKDVDTRTERVEETARRTEVDVEKDSDTRRR